MTKLSIIVPIYNTDKYLQACIESLCKQTLKNMEIILIDDGSTDGSTQLCDEYAKKDSRIKVIHQKNSGRVKARMEGLLSASSENVMFVDSDDWIDEEMCAALLEIMQREDVDLVTSGYILEKNFYAESVIEIVPEMAYKTETDMQFLIENAMVYNNEKEFGIHPINCAKLFKKDILINVMKDVPKDMYWAEDQVLIMLYLLRCKSVYVSHTSFYHYRIHEASTSSSSCHGFFGQMAMFYETLQKVLHEKKQINALQIRTLRNLAKIWNRQEMLAVRMPYYHFDYENLGAGKVVLYGAGDVGKDYFWQLKKMSPNKMVLWVDKAYKTIQSENYDVHSVNEIRTVSFDKLLIAVEPEMLASKIREELVLQYNIPDEKIIWFKPKTLWV